MELIVVKTHWKQNISMSVICVFDIIRDDISEKQPNERNLPKREATVISFMTISNIHG